MFLLLFHYNELFLFVLYFLVFMFFLWFGALCLYFFFFQAEDGIRDRNVTGVQTCALPILPLCNGRDELAGEFREGRQRGLLLCHSRRRRLVSGETRGVAASPELHELAEHLGARVLSGPLRPLPPPTASEIGGAALVLFVRVHRGLGALLRGDDARPGLRRPPAEARATPGCAPAGLPLHFVNLDAHGRMVVGRRAALREFHDSLLAFGAPPLGLAR